MCLLIIPASALSVSGSEGIISAHNCEHPLIIGCKGSTNRAKYKTKWKVFLECQKKFVTLHPPFL